jgi:type III restriction enzyme
MTYFVDRVVICDAYKEPDKHYRLLPGSRSELTNGRRPSIRYLTTSQQARSGLSAIVGQQGGLFKTIVESDEEENDFVNKLRDELREWRGGIGRWSGQKYGGTALVTRRLLEWWFEREEERTAEGTRIFFCQQEAIEAIIYLYEVKQRYKMPDTGLFVRYALKMATGTGKTCLMALIITWSCLHKRSVSGSSLSDNFLVLVPNLTVMDRVSGRTRGDGLETFTRDTSPFNRFKLVPEEYVADFHPKVRVANWQSIPLISRRDDWIPEDNYDNGDFVPHSVLRALARRSASDPDNGIRKVIGHSKDLVILNDEAHHAYGEKRSKKGDEPGFIRWSHILERLAKITRVSLVVDTSATPWYGTGSAKPEGTLFEWLISDFSVYDAFESGLVKVVRLPEVEGQGPVFLDLWDRVREAKTEIEYISACKEAIAALYSSWGDDFEKWANTFPMLRVGPQPVMLVVVSDGTRAEWVWRHLTKDYPLLRNDDASDPASWVTIQVDSKTFDADKGREGLLREMVSTIGRQGAKGEHVRCVVSVNMLAEGWDVNAVTHILGLRAFGSPLLTEQVIGRGLRKTNYDILNEPLEKREIETDETVDAFGIPFVGFPVQKRKRAKIKGRQSIAHWIETSEKRARFRLRIPNVRSWAVAVNQPLANIVNVRSLKKVEVKTVAAIEVRPVVGGKPEDIITLERFRDEWPLTRTKFEVSNELIERLTAAGASDLNSAPTFDELFDLSSCYIDNSVVTRGKTDLRDVGIYKWRYEVIDVLDNAIRNAGTGVIATIPILGKPDYFDTAEFKRFQWAGIVYEPKRSHLNLIPCASPLESEFAAILDSLEGVISYVKNERWGFSITYYEQNRPRQYYPDFIVLVKEDKDEVHWICEPKGEMRSNTLLKRDAANVWCERMTNSGHGRWRYLFVPETAFNKVKKSHPRSFNQLAAMIAASSD